MHKLKPGMSRLVCYLVDFHCKKCGTRFNPNVSNAEQFEDFCSEKCEDDDNNHKIEME
jgi:endogenous inhibitor of DNA gyrase (YacG/DUF329 family)